MRQLHELLWYLAEALTLPRAQPMQDELLVAQETTEGLTRVRCSRRRRPTLPVQTSSVRTCASTNCAVRAFGALCS